MGQNEEMIASLGLGRVIICTLPVFHYTFYILSLTDWMPWTGF